MTETERIVRIFHESWDLSDPDRGANVIAEDCHFEDVARGELLPGPEAYKRDYHRWREAFPDGECTVVSVIDRAGRLGGRGVRQPRHTDRAPAFQPRDLPTLGSPSRSPLLQCHARG